MLIREARIHPMHPIWKTLAIAALSVMASAAASEQAAQGLVRGQVTDNSGGVLPGVTVVATVADGRAPVAVVTDGSGAYETHALPVGPVTLTFQLEGFATQAVAVAVRPGAESRVVVRLELARLSETVDVHAPAPVDPVIRARPSPAIRPVPAHDRDSICGPAKPETSPTSLGTIKSGRDTPAGLYAEGAELAIDGGLANGLDAGRNVVVRRYYRAWGAPSGDTVGEHSAGLLQIVEASERTSVAVVVYACDELRQGDFLAPFDPEPIRSPEPRGIPAYSDAARILFADEGQTLGAPRRLMVIDRGTDHGTRVGERFALFRQRPGSAAREPTGDAVVVSVRTDSATIRIDRLTDAIFAGDWAAPQTASAAARRHP
jgi:hypothetical protein